MAQETIVAAGNTEVPAYLTLIELGYSVDRVDRDREEHWIAKKGTLDLVADGLLELLGVRLSGLTADNEVPMFTFDRSCTNRRCLVGFRCGTPAICALS